MELVALRSLRSAVCVVRVGVAAAVPKVTPEKSDKWQGILAGFAIVHHFQEFQECSGILKHFLENVKILEGFSKISRKNQSIGHF